MGGRTKTKYPGVYYRNARRRGKAGTERVYYIVFKKGGRVFEEKVGRQYADAMTPAEAAEIRAQIVNSKRLSRQEIRKQERTEKESEEKLRRRKISQENPESMMLEEEWLLFMESATNSFSLWDSELNVLEINAATLMLMPEGTRKKDIIGKNFSELSPDSKQDGVYDKFLQAIKTGNPIIIEDFTPPPRFGEDVHLNVKAFKVGKGLGIILTDITERTRAERELRKREHELEHKTVDLEEMNTALNVLLKKREKDKSELEENIISNVKELIEPYLEKMKNSRLDDRQKIYMDIIEANLNDIVSPFVRVLNTDFLALTHTEIQISNLVKRGRTTKEIAELLSLSAKTIASYREQIREKLGIKNRKINLRTYLISIQ
ncbi:MAG: PAS domain-containing protein [Deltaproteobacteria bacterium]|nr:PAS domain-containing protein [Deltaproteobacteria bacterium]